MVVWKRILKGALGVLVTLGDKNSLKEITFPYNQAGFAVASFDQYTQGERKLHGSKSLLVRAEAFAQRANKTMHVEQTGLKQRIQQ